LKKKFYNKLFSKISFSGFLKPVSKVCKMGFDIFEKYFHILQEISFCPVGPLIAFGMGRTFNIDYTSSENLENCIFPCLCFGKLQKLYGLREKMDLQGLTRVLTNLPVFTDPCKGFKKLSHDE
jgi:hypothetical protein